MAIFNVIMLVRISYTILTFVQQPLLCVEEFTSINLYYAWYYVSYVLIDCFYTLNNTDLQKMKKIPAHNKACTHSGISCKHAMCRGVCPSILHLFSAASGVSVDSSFKIVALMYYLWIYVLKFISDAFFLVSSQVGSQVNFFRFTCTISFLVAAA